MLVLCLTLAKLSKVPNSTDRKRVYDQISRILGSESEVRSGASGSGGAQMYLKSPTFCHDQVLPASFWSYSSYVEKKSNLFRYLKHIPKTMLRETYRPRTMLRSHNTHQTYHRGLGGKIPHNVSSIAIMSCLTLLQTPAMVKIRQLLPNFTI